MRFVRRLAAEAGSMAHVSGMPDATPRSMIYGIGVFGQPARNFMQTDLVTVTPETSVFDIQRMFVEEEIHGAPVVDDDGVVRGVVSSLDLLRIARDDHDATSSYFSQETPYAADWTRVPESLHDRLRGMTAADAMTRELVSVSPDAPIAEVARVMRDQRIHRVLVLEAGELVGVITSFDLLRAFVREPPAPDQPIDYDPSA